MMKTLFTTFILIPVAFCFDSRFPSSQLTTDAYVGTPKRSFYLRLETGSPKAWIMNGKYPTPSDDNNFYNASLSSTSQSTNTYSEAYSGVYTASGYDTSDSFDFEFDFAEFPSYQKFTSVEKIVSDIETNPEILLDGVMGLAWDPSKVKDQLNQSPSPDFPPVVNIFYRKHPKAYIVSPNWITWNEVTTSSCQSNTEYFDLKPGTSKKYPLAFQVDGIKFDNFEKKSQYSGVLDTGLDLVYLPKQILDSLARKIPFTYNKTTRFNMIDCDQADKLQPVVFEINGKKFEMNAKQYVLDLRSWPPEDDEKCTLAFDTSDSLTVDFGFGKPFLESCCFVFDLDRNQVGLAVANNN